MTSPVSLRAVIPEALAATIRAIGARYRIRNIRVFGSLARGDARPDSDVDLLVEYEPERRVSLFDHIGTALHLEEVLGVPRVDLLIRHCVVDELKERIYGEAIDVFGPDTVEVQAQAHVGGGRDRFGIHPRT
jgi:predicted nucleotidyltransferase